MAQGHNCNPNGIIQALENRLNERANKRRETLLGANNFLPTSETNWIKRQWNKLNNTFNANNGLDVSDAGYLRSRDEYYNQKRNNPFNDAYTVAESSLKPTQINGQEFSTRDLADVVDQYLAVKGKLHGVRNEASWAEGLNESELQRLASHFESIIEQSPETKTLVETHYQTQRDVSEWAKDYGIDYNPDPDALPHSVVQLLESSNSVGSETFANMRRLFKEENHKIWNTISNHMFKEKVVYDYGQPYQSGMDLNGYRKIKARPADVIETAMGQERPIDTLYRMNRNALEDIHPDIQEGYYVIPEKYAQDIDKHTAQHPESPIWSTLKSFLGGGPFFKQQVTGSASNPGFVGFVARQATQDFTMIGNHPEAISSLPDVWKPLWSFFVQGNESVTIIAKSSDGNIIHVPVKELAKGGITDNLSMDNQGKSIELASLKARINTGKGWIDMALGIPGIKHGVLGINHLMSNPLKVNQWRESLVRTASAIQFMKEGKTLPEAHYLSGERTINIDTLTPSERRDIAGAISPFYSVLKTALISTAKSATNQNGFAATVGFYGLGVMIPAAIDTYNQLYHAEAYERLKRTTPKGVNYIILGTDQDGETFVLPYLSSQSMALNLSGLGGLEKSISSFISHSVQTGDYEAALEKATDDFMEGFTGNGNGVLSSIPFAGAAEETLKGVLSPGLKLGAELLTNHNPDTGQQIIKEGDDVWDIGKKIAGEAGKTFFPAGSRLWKPFSKALPDDVNTALNPDFVPDRNDNAKYSSIFDSFTGLRKDINSSANLFMEEKEAQEQKSKGLYEGVQSFKGDLKDFRRIERRSLNQYEEYASIKSPTIRSKVQSLISSGDDSDGISLSKIQKAMNSIDQVYADIKAGKDTDYTEQDVIDAYERINGFYQTWKAESEIRKKVAIKVAQMYPDREPSELGKIYRYYLNYYSELGESPELESE